jgi:hypothetical protein
MKNLLTLPENFAISMAILYEQGKPPLGMPVQSQRGNAYARNHNSLLSIIEVQGRLKWSHFDYGTIAIYI